MDNTSRMDDDDEVTPEDRLARVRAAFVSAANLGGLRASLAEVTACLAGDAGQHRDLLTRLKERLEAALQ